MPTYHLTFHTRDLPLLKPKQGKHKGMACGKNREGNVKLIQTISSTPMQ